MTKSFTAIVFAIFLAVNNISYATDTYDSNTETLTIPHVRVDSSEENTAYNDVVLNLTSGFDINFKGINIYDINTKMLTLPQGKINDKTYDNIVIDLSNETNIVKNISSSPTLIPNSMTKEGLMIGSYITAEKLLKIPQILAGDITYNDVELQLKNEAKVHFKGINTYDPVTKILTIPQVKTNDITYYNVVLNLQADFQEPPLIPDPKLIPDSITSKGLIIDTYDGATQELKIPQVLIMGDKIYNDVVIKPTADPLKYLADDGSLVEKSDQNIVNNSNQSGKIDSYDPASNKLTVPKLKFDDTEYNDVVIKLNDLDLISEGFKMKFDSAIRHENKLDITFELTSKEDNSYCLGCYKGMITANLADGKVVTYNENSVKILGIKETCLNPDNKVEEPCSSIKHLFQASTPTKVTYSFNDVDPVITNINLFEIVIGSPIFELQNLPITN